MSRAKNSQIIVSGAIQKTKLSEFENDGNGDVAFPFITSADVVAPTLQQVTDAGNTTNNGINILGGRSPITVDDGLGSNSYIDPYSVDLVNDINNTFISMKNPNIGLPYIFFASNLLSSGISLLPTSVTNGYKEIYLPDASGVILVISDIITAPISSTDTGSKGEVRIVGVTRYECIATDTWVKSTVVTSF